MKKKTKKQSPSRTRTPAARRGWTIGECYLIRTVTMFWTGRLVSIDEHELVLEDAAWIADTGRYHQATAAEALREVEPVAGDAILGRGAVVDAIVWPSALPRTPK
jgi:hypothetical protein